MSYLVFIAKFVCCACGKPSLGEFLHWSHSMEFEYDRWGQVYKDIRLMWIKISNNKLVEMVDCK